MTLAFTKLLASDACDVVISLLIPDHVHYERHPPVVPKNPRNAQAQLVPHRRALAAIRVARGPNLFDIKNTDPL
jgi:hypothetical protein